MKEKTKYLLIGLVIGIAIGALAIYLVMRFGALRPYGLRDFVRTENMTNFTRPFNQASGG